MRLVVRLALVLSLSACLSNCEETRPPIVPPGPCGPYTCENLDVECGTRLNPCGGADLACPNTCDLNTQHCENLKCVAGACEPTTCEDAGADCGSIDNECGGDPVECPECEEGFHCASNQCVSDSCSDGSCEDSNFACGAIWNPCDGEVVECNSSCSSAQSCSGGACVSPSQPVINEFVFSHDGSGLFDYVELFGAPNFNLSLYTLLLIEGDLEDNTGKVLRVYHPGGNGTASSLDANGFWLSPFGQLSVSAGTVTILLVKNLIGTVAVGIDLDATNNEDLDSNTATFSLIDAIAVSDPVTLETGTNIVYENALILTPGFGGLSTTVQGASRIPNGKDTNNTDNWTRNDFGGFGLPGFSSPAASVGEAINTPAGQSNVASGGYNLSVPVQVPISH